MNNFKYSNSDEFIKIHNQIINRAHIVNIDCENIEQLDITIKLINGEILKANDIHAIEFLMQVKPSIFEGKRFLWGKWMWFIHNVFGHPLTQFFALFKKYKIAFWIHDVTVPKPLGKKIKS